MKVNKEFREWFDNWCKTEKVNRPVDLIVDIEFAGMWESDINIIRENAWGLCVTYNYATKEQFDIVFNEYYKTK
jgi:hypothetical protein